MQEKAMELNQLSSEPIIELGFYYMMIERYEKAYDYFTNATNFDSMSMTPSIGMVRCQILRGEIEDAESQLEFLKEMSNSMGGRNSSVAFLEGMLKGRRSVGRTDFTQMEENLKESNKSLDESLSLYMKSIKGIPHNLKYYINLNPDFLISLTNEFLYHSDFSLEHIKEKIQNPTTPTHLIKKANKVIQIAIKKVPGLIPAYMLAAKAKTIMGDMNGAIQSLKKSLEMDPKNEEAHILQAIIVYSNGNIESAYSSIKEALANNFDIDRNPFFMMIKGQIEFEMGNQEEGLKTLSKAYNLPGVQIPEEKEQISKNRYMSIIGFNDNIRAQIFVYYAKALSRAGEVTKAKEVIEASIMEFAGTDEEPIVLLGNADIQIISGDLKKALGILNSVEPNAKAYMEARKKLADIYLNEMKQRRQYAKCYQDLADNFPTFENIKLYGDALMKILEPEDAIKVYQEALDIEPQNMALIREIGKAMATTHYYQRALDYYEEKTAEFPQDEDLKVDYVQLLVKSNYLDKAQELIDPNQVYEELQDKNLLNVKRKVRKLRLLQSIAKKRLEESPDNDSWVKYLLSISPYILTSQFEAIERAKIDGGSPNEEKLLYAEYSEEAGNLIMRYEPNPVEASTHYQEAMKYNPNRLQLVLELAELDYIQGNYEEAEAKASRIMKIEQSNAEAIKLLGECLLVKGELEKGIKGFTRVFKRDNTNFMALGELIIFYRHEGNLDTAKKILDRVEERLGKSSEPGLCYCRGLYAYFKRNPNEALLQFNRARRNKLYKQQSLRYMADIYLNPGQELLFTSKEAKPLQFTQGQIESLFTIVNDMSSKHYVREKEVYECYLALLISQDKKELEKKLQRMIEENRQFLPAYICLAFLRIYTKKKADRDLLKTISKIRFNPRWGDQWERGSLLVVDYLIYNKKTDLAESQIKKTIKVNKSCWKGWEMFGEMKQKQDNLVLAQKYFTQGWNITDKQNCEIGYRLANLAFKDKLWVRAISIANEVRLFWVNILGFED